MLSARVMMVASTKQAVADAQRLVELYEETEMFLLVAVRDAVRTSLSESDPAARQRELNTLLDKAQERLNRVGRLVGDQAQLVALEEYTAAIEDVFEEVAKTPPEVTASLAASSAAGETVEALRSQHIMVARQVRDVYQQVTSTTVMAAEIGTETHVKAVQAALNRFADKGITSFVDKAGRKWSMDVYTDMAVRTMRNNVKQQGHLDGYRSAGVKLVRASWHPASAPQCFPYQNQLLAITGEAGKRVLTDPATGEKVTVYVKERLDEAIANGYHHPNCKHRDTAYTPGDPTPTVSQASEEENDRQYKASQRQRQIERNIRKWKKRESVALDDNEARAAKGKVRQWQAAQRAHVNSHSYLSRLPHREQVRTGDRTRG